MITRRELLTGIAGSVGAATFTFALTSALAPPASAFPGPAPVRLEELASTGLADIEAQVRVVSADQSELCKINRDFGMAYRLRNLTMRYKEPNKLRTVSYTHLTLPTT